MLFRHTAAPLFLASAVLLTGSPSLAQEVSSTSAENVLHSHWYLGAGVAQLELDNDHPSIGNRNGSGAYVVGGYQRYDRLSFELSSASTSISVAATCDPNLPQTCQAPYYPEDSAEYYNLLMVIRLGFPLQNYPHLQPWVATGFAYHYYSWDTFWYYVDGSAPFFGAGLDVTLGKRWDLRLEVSHTRYDGSDSYGSGSYRGSTRQFDAALIYNFR